jgi:hypothetical protein
MCAFERNHITAFELIIASRILGALDDCIDLLEEIRDARTQAPVPPTILHSWRERRQLPR